MVLPGLIGSAMYGELKSFGGGDDLCDDRAMAKDEGINSRLDLGRMKEPTEDIEEDRTRDGEGVRLGDIPHNVALNRSIQSRDESRRDDRALGALADDVVAAVDGCDFGRGG